MMKFIATNPDDIGKKRSQARRACIACRRAKRRCRHVSTSLPSNSSGVERTDVDIREVRHSQASLELHSPTPKKQRIDPPTGHSREIHERFIGYLNPEGVFLSATSPGTARRNSAVHDDIGIWLVDKFKAAHGDSTLPQDRPGMFYGSISLTHQVVLQVLEAEVRSLIPPDDCLRSLLSFYFSRVHLLFPIINHGELQKRAEDDSAHVLLLQGICLVAAMSPSCKQYLRFRNSMDTLSPLDFMRQLHSAMRSSIEIGLVTEKRVLLQATALMALFTDGPDGADMSSQLCARTVQTLHTLGLHLGKSQKALVDDYDVTMLCCVWALDKLNAAFHGRPVQMHERDLGRNIEACMDQQGPEFRLLLKVIALLDQIIELYRPSTSPEAARADNDFPLFEDCAGAELISQVPTSSLATAEMLHYAVAILSCRSRGFNVNPPSIFHNRQGLAAARIMSLASADFKDHLTVLPIVPYALSLSLSIAYREMRHTNIPLHRALARQKLQQNCDALEELSEQFWLASNMAHMGNMTLKEMDRVFASAAETQRHNDVVGVDVLEATVIARGGEPVSDESQDTQDSSSRAVQTDNVAVGDAQMHDFGMGMPTDMSISDPFGMFDPEFNLDAMDAYFDSNLDLSGFGDLP